MNRRNFIATGLASSSLPFIKANATQKAEKVRLAFIGVGLRGRNHVEQSLYREDVEITAICDIDPDAIKRTLAITKKFNRKDPAVYGKNDMDFLNMLQRDDIDGVVVATPWEWHVPMSV
jgi:predicted dehydrogenase